jgi:hypothetical protein
MPTELRAAPPSVDAGPALLQFEKETRRRKRIGDRALTGTTATQVLSLINSGQSRQIRLIFSW